MVMLASCATVFKAVVPSYSITLKSAFPLATCIFIQTLSIPKGNGSWNSRQYSSGVEPLLYEWFPCAEKRVGVSSRHPNVPSENSKRMLGMVVVSEPCHVPPIFATKKEPSSAWF